MIHYRNTDLSVSSTSLRILDKALKDAGLVALGDIPAVDELLTMSYETDSQHRDPEPNIEVFLNVIEALSGEALHIWETCEQREFDIGYQCDTEPWSFHQSLSPELLTRIVATNARLKITLYAAERS